RPRRDGDGRVHRAGAVLRSARLGGTKARRTGRGRPGVVLLASALCLLLAFTACRAQDGPASPASVVPTAGPAVRTGAQRLVDTGFRDLAGWRVGLVTNPTARVDTADGGPAHLIDRLAEAPNVT